MEIVNNWVELWTCRCGYTGLPTLFHSHEHNPKPWSFVVIPWPINDDKATFSPLLDELPS